MVTYLIAGGQSYKHGYLSVKSERKRIVTKARLQCSASSLSQVVARNALVGQPWPIKTILSENGKERAEILHFLPTGTLRSSFGDVGIWWFTQEQGQEMVDCNIKFTILQENGRSSDDDSRCITRPWHFTANLRDSQIQMGGLVSDEHGVVVGRFASMGQNSRSLGTKTQMTTGIDSSLPQRQQWALMDNVPKYTVNAATCLWRRMIEEVPELCGFAPSELRLEWLRMTGLDDDINTLATPALLDEWVWNGDEDPSGGRFGGDLSDGSATVSGRIYGSSFVADGTHITTRPVIAPAISTAASVATGQNWAELSSNTAFHRAAKDGYVVVSVPPMAGYDFSVFDHPTSNAFSLSVPGTREVILELGNPRSTFSEPVAGDSAKAVLGGLMNSITGRSTIEAETEQKMRLFPPIEYKAGEVLQSSLPMLLAAGTTAAVLGVLQSHVTLQMFWVS